MSAALDSLLAKLDPVRKNGAGWMARCPAHEDPTPSLSIHERNGKILVKCFAGCSFESICAAAGTKPGELFSDNGAVPSIVATYDYTDESGALLYQVLRYEPGFGGEKKTFRQRRPGGKGGWIDHLDCSKSEKCKCKTKLPPVRRVPYQLLGVGAADQVIICEGEKDAETATLLALPATCGTCNAGGAGKWRDEHSEFLRGKHVVIIADADEPGRKHAQQVASSVHHVAASVKGPLEMPGAKDLTEWKERGGTKEQFEELIRGAPLWTNKSVLVQVLTSRSTSELFTAKEEKVDWLSWPVASPGFSVIIDALPKDGKTRLLLEAIIASRQGRQFLNWPTKPMRVVYVSEQSAASLAMQVREVSFTGQEPIEELRWLTREDWFRFPYQEFLEKLERQFLEGSGYNTLIIDTFHTVASLEDERDAAEVNRVGNLTLDVAARQKLALVLGRHDRKSQGPVGISGRNSIQLSGLMDVILHLLRTPVPTQRRLEVRGRVPGLPSEVLIELNGNEYVKYGNPEKLDFDRVAQVRTWLKENPNLAAADVKTKLAVIGVDVSIATAKRDLKQAREDQQRKVRYDHGS